MEGLGGQDVALLFGRTLDVGRGVHIGLMAHLDALTLDVHQPELGNAMT